MLCKYKDALGEPRKGVHSIRIFDFAAIDILLTVLVSVIISKTLNINVLLILIILLIKQSHPTSSCWRTLTFDRFTSG